MAHEEGEESRQWRIKRLPRQDGPFQVLERINNDVYKSEQQGEYNDIDTFK